MNKKQQALFNIRNPWQQNKGFLMPPKYIIRKLEKDLRANIKSDDILIIYGSRQAGKTTLLYKIIQDLHKAGAAKEDLFYFSADDALLKDYFKEPSKLIEFVLSKKKKRAYLFIDEAQRLVNPGIFLKNLYDYKIKDIKIIATGSSTLEIKSKIIEYLPGRKKVFMLYPLSYGEIVDFKKLKDVEQKKGAWREYMLFGGYPKVYLAPSSRQKKQELSDIYESYIKKDISGYMRIAKPEKFNQLALLLSEQITGLVNIDELTNTLRINRATVEKYLLVLEDTFVIKKILPFFNNPRTEITKMSKIYFLDLGIRNTILKNFNPSDQRGDMGKLAENFALTQFVYNEDIDTAINFWRTKSGAEIDFVVNRGGEINLYEVKYAKTIKGAGTAAINSFARKYKFNQAFILTSGIDKRKGNCLPFWKIRA